jgi:hypothetical protein
MAHPSHSPLFKHPNIRRRVQNLSSSLWNLLHLNSCHIFLHQSSLSCLLRDTRYFSLFQLHMKTKIHTMCVHLGSALHRSNAANENCVAVRRCVFDNVYEQAAMSVHLRSKGQGNSSSWQDKETALKKRRKHATWPKLSIVVVADMKHEGMERLTPQEIPKCFIFFLHWH